MKRMLWAVAAMGLAAAGTVNADWGGFAPPPQQQQQQQGPPVQPAGGEFSAPSTLMGMGQNNTGRAPDRYGLMPGLRKAFRVGGAGCDTCGKPGLFSKGGGGCANGNCGPFHGGYGHGGYGGHGGQGGGGGYGGYGNDGPQYPPTMQGTLVYPNHQFVRSPRDFFMYEPGR